MKRKIAVWILIVAVLHPAALVAQTGAVPATVVAAASSASAAAAPPAIEPDPSAVHLVAGRSTVLDVGSPITRVSLTSADIADALVTSSTQLLIHGKLPGTISLFVWERAGGVHRYEVVVARDVARLSEQVQKLFPTEKVQVASNGRDVVLSGNVSTKEVVDQLINLSAGFVDKKEEVVSLLRVQSRPSNQVLLRVRFAEVSRAALTELGISLFTSPTGIRNTLGRVTTQQFSAPGYSDLAWTKGDSSFGGDVTSAEGKFTFSDFLNLFILSEKYDLGVLIRALQTRGLFQSLAEPNLVAESGKEASFLAGGEFPIPITQPGGGNAITVQFKEFGVRLSFTPVVQGNRVHLKVRPEVSTLDFANGIHLDGFRIPSLISRRTETELELADGQTFAIAGLLNNTMNSTMQKIPGIGDIPVLGYLFRSKAAQKNRTELVVMITPQILPEGSAGVTRDLPRMGEPYLAPLPEKKSIAPPPPAYPQPQAPQGNALVTPEQAPVAFDPAPPTVAAATTSSPAGVQSAPAAAAPAPSPAEQKAQAEAARVQKAQAEAERRRLQAEDERQKKAARQQAERDAAAAKRQAEIERHAADAAKRKAEADAKRQAEEAKRQAEEARRKADAEKKRQAAIDEAAARLDQAKSAYDAEVRSATR